MSRMNAFEQVALAGQAVARTLACVPRPATWWPWLALGAVQAAAVAAIWNVAHPWVSWALAGWVAGQAGEGALHYPGLFESLPGLVAPAGLAIGALLGPVAIGAATVLFARVFRGAAPRPGAALREAARRAPALVIANLPFHLGLLGLSLGVGGWLERSAAGGAAAALGAAALGAGSVLVQTLFFYVTGLVMLAGLGPVAALARLPRTWSRGFWAALALGVLALAALLPLQLARGRLERVVERGVPELVGGLALVEIAVTLAVWYVLAGGATLVYLAAIAGDREDP